MKSSRMEWLAQQREVNVKGLTEDSHVARARAFWLGNGTMDRIVPWRGSFSEAPYFVPALGG
jgi:hypothetical protein